MGHCPQGWVVVGPVGTAVVIGAAVVGPVGAAVDGPAVVGAAVDGAAVVGAAVWVVTPGGTTANETPCRSSTILLYTVIEHIDKLLEMKHFNTKLIQDVDTVTVSKSWQHLTFYPISI